MRFWKKTQQNLLTESIEQNSVEVDIAVGPHDMEATEKLQYICIDIFMLSNLMTVPKSVSSDSARGSGR